jgi:hypothetical protein
MLCMLSACFLGGGLVCIVWHTAKAVPPSQVIWQIWYPLLPRACLPCMNPLVPVLALSSGNGNSFHQVQAFIRQS